MSNSPDRMVVATARGDWEVRIPDSPRPGVRADTYSTAVEWAQNITRDTGGAVIIQRRRKVTVQTRPLLQRLQ
jgi:hypothetical protein